MIGASLTVRTWPLQCAACHRWRDSTSASYQSPRGIVHRAGGVGEATERRSISDRQ